MVLVGLPALYMWLGLGLCGVGGAGCLVYVVRVRVSVRVSVRVRVRGGAAVDGAAAGGDTSLINTSNSNSIDPTGRQWIQFESNAQCDVSAGEVYRSESSGKVSDLAACQKSCEDDAHCSSITYYKAGWCSHFSTDCARRKGNNKAMVWMRRRGTSTSTTHPCKDNCFVFIHRNDKQN